tara:strand:- start:1881 stop:2540 length:660 start_codon:yes stop_codon:yes gene_type:complete
MQYLNTYKKIIGVLCLVCLILILVLFNTNKNKSRIESQVASLSDTLRLYKNKDGKNSASIKVLEGTKSELLAITEKQDKHLNELLKVKGLRTVTTHSVITKTDTIVKLDTIQLATPTTQLYISKSIDNEYYKANITIKGDSLTLKQTSYNQFDYLLRDVRPKGLFGFLKPTTYIVEAINLNPNTYTKDLRTLEIKPKTNTGLKISIGLAVGIAAVLLIK